MSSEDRQFSFQDLPGEVVNEILKYLSFDDLKNFNLVSRFCKELGEDPVLWRLFQLKLYEENINFLGDILALRRFSMLKSVRCYGNLNITDDIMEKLIHCENVWLENIDMELCNLSAVQPQSVGLLTKFRSVNVGDCNLSRQQLAVLFERLSNSENRTEELNIAGNESRVEKNKLEK